MKRLSLLFLSLALPILILVSCEQSGSKTAVLQGRVDSLQNKLKSAYVPGTGEIMNSIIVSHHLKLWLAGEHKNWVLAGYEQHMLLGGFTRIQKYHKGTPEATAVPMIFPAMDAVKKAIQDKDANAFKSNYALLTTACNTCHQALKYGFNVVTVPTPKNQENQSF
jgi:cytochrome c553